MAATMHNQDNNRQPLNHAPPAWLRPVKIAVVVMGVLIILGLGLLFYGFYAGIGRLAAPQTLEQNFTYPKGAELVAVSASGDGQVLLRFKMTSGGEELILIDVASTEIIGQVSLKTSDKFGFSEE